LFIENPPLACLEPTIWRLRPGPGHAFVEGNVRLWLDIVNVEKTAVIVKQVLRQVEAVVLPTVAENLLAVPLVGLRGFFNIG
jgi:hypothetical protein